MKIFQFFSLIVSFLILGSFSTSAQINEISKLELQIRNGDKVEIYSESHALIIGVSKYQDTAWAELESVPSDLREIKRALNKHGFNVETILNPTKQDMDDEIERFIGKYGYDENNRLLFYYSGHGFTQERNGRKFGYIVPSDAPNPLNDEKGFFRKSLKMTRFISWAEEIESKHALFVFDSCFSGSVLPSKELLVPEKISHSTLKPVRQFISAGSANEPVPAKSIFRPLFIRGINGVADLDGDGYVTGSEIGIYLQKKVPTYKSQQTPQYGKINNPYLDEGNFVFFIPAKESKHNKDNQNKEFLSNAELLYRKYVDGTYIWSIDGNERFDDKYNGETYNSLPNGQGILTFTDGSKYEGQFKDGDLHGHGIIKHKSGEKYVGEFKNNKFHGKGTYYYLNGDVHIGEYKYDEANGYGTLILGNGNWEGDKYEGYFLNGQYNGKGTYFYANGAKYFGNFLNNSPNGIGTLIHGEGKYKGDRYVGEFSKWLYNGNGIYFFSNGNINGGIYKDNKPWNTIVSDKKGNILGRFEEGDFLKEDIIENSNKLSSSNITNFKTNWVENKEVKIWVFDGLYTGQQKNGKPHGHGRFVWESLNYPKEGVLKGNFINGKLNGEGESIYPNGNTYKGFHKDNERHGLGTMVYNSGSKYIGNWADNDRSGKGIIHYNNGDIFEGYWENNKINGKGVYSYVNGDIFEGIWKDSIRNGEGVYKYFDGESWIGVFKDNKDWNTVGYDTNNNIIGRYTRGNFIKETKIKKYEVDKEFIFWGFKGLYTGETEEGIPNGRGRFVFKDIKNSVDGEFKGNFIDGKLNGEGTLIYSDGESFSGEFRDGKKNGKGIYTYANGSKYEGEYKDDLQNGKGIYTSVSGDKYIGDYLDGKTNGTGTYIFSNGNKYEGEFKDGQYHGHGTFTYKNGSKYVGSFRHNKKSGFGTYTYGAGKWEGDKYVGEYKNDNYNGQGIYTFASGDTYEGEHKNGKAHGQGIYTFQNGMKEIGESKDGKPWNIIVYDKNGDISYRYVNGVIQK